ncbi:hypothetical protein CRYUN_Cryun40dG0061700 [Craigia yunnanensis]
MIGIKDLYSVLTAVVPLYVTMFLAYASVKWWNIFAPEQCAGINRETRTFVLSKFKESSFSNLEREKETFKGTGEKLGGNCGSEEEVINVIATTPSNQQTAQNFNKIAPDQSQRLKPMVASSMEGEGKELHFFIWRFGCCISPDGTSTCEQSVQVGQREESSGKVAESEKQGDVENASMRSSLSSSMLLKILRKVWFKLVRNPNSYSSLLGLSWALVSCSRDIKKPQIMENSVTILSSAGHTINL